MGGDADDVGTRLGSVVVDAYAHLRRMHVNATTHARRIMQANIAIVGWQWEAEAVGPASLPQQGQSRRILARPLA